MEDVGSDTEEEKRHKEKLKSGFHIFKNYQQGKNKTKGLKATSIVFCIQRVLDLRSQVKKSCSSRFSDLL